MGTTDVVEELDAADAAASSSASADELDFSSVGVSSSRMHKAWEKLFCQMGGQIPAFKGLKHCMIVLSNCRRGVVDEEENENDGSGSGDNNGGNDTNESLSLVE